MHSFTQNHSQGHSNGDHDPQAHPQAHPQPQCVPTAPNKVIDPHLNYHLFRSWF